MCTTLIAQAALGHPALPIFLEVPERACLHRTLIPLRLEEASNHVIAEVVMVPYGKEHDHHTDKHTLHAADV